MVVGGIVIGVAFLALWVTAPQWAAPLRGHPGPPANQTYVLVNTTLWRFGGTATCWVDRFGAGATIPAGGQFHAWIQLTYPLGNATPPCTIHSVDSLTSGFTLVSTSAPLALSFGEQGSLYANVTVPDASWTGSVTFLLNVTSP
jgi:hypothetical protein